MRIPVAAIVLLALGSAAAAQAPCTGVAPISHTGLETVVVANGLVNRPLLALSPPGDDGRVFLVEQDGYIRIHRRGDPPGVTSLFLDVSAIVTTVGSEQGLLGMAFDPDFATNRRLYINYTETNTSGLYTRVIARYEASALDPDVADIGTALRVFSFVRNSTIHNGGQLLFGPDGFLYFFSGDGGGQAGCGQAQELTNLRGKILRLDVRGIDPAGTAADCGNDGNYTIPSDNPFSDGIGGDCDEIYAYGLRNPWRNDIDPLTGDLYVADVGDNCWEEVNWQPPGSQAGANFGWLVMQAMHCFDPSDRFNCDPPAIACGAAPPCGDPSLALPVLEYAHGPGCSITGGHVYRGCRMPSLHGTYFYGDYCGGFVRSFRMQSDVAAMQRDWTVELLEPDNRLAGNFTSFGKNARDELLLVSRAGEILKVVPLFTDLSVSAPGAADPFLLGPTTWAWEDLAFETEFPVTEYRVYRGVPNGTFSCVHASATPEWLGGDPSSPSAGGLFAYLVTAVTGTPPNERETSPGEPAASRTLDTTACP